MIFKNSADLRNYYEKNRLKVEKQFLDKYRNEIKFSQLFTIKAKNIGVKFLKEYLQEQGIDITGCDCQLKTLSHLLLFSVQDDIRRGEEI